MSKVLDHPSRKARESSGGGSDGIDLSERLTRVETILENTPNQQDVGEIKTSIERVKTLIAEKASAIQSSIEAVKTLIAEKQTSALRWSILALAAVVAGLAALIVAFKP